ncbi:MAG: OmpA family protein [Deltaproteobacteria bacterium]|nr:OmpA family protein [Deltaproteobacteria bacterium]
MRREGIPVFLAALSLAVLFLGGCAGPAQLKVEPIATTENPTAQINRLENDMGAARKDQINVLSPTWFAKAETSLNGAKKGLQRGESLSEILQNVAVGQAQLRQAGELAKVSKATLPDAIKARDLAMAAGATEFGRDFGEVEESFLDLTKAIENNDLDWARRHQGGVVNAFDQLELRAIKEKTLGEARGLIDKAEREGARKLTPGTLAVAKRKLAEADAFISGQRYQKEKVQEVASDVVFHARRLTQVTQESEKVKTMQPEQITLWVEGILGRVTGKLAAPDMRNENFNVQEENILGSIDGLQKDQKFLAEKVKTQQVEIETKKKELADLQESTRKQLASLDEASRKQIVALEGEAAQVRAEKERLAAEREFQLKFNDVRTFFSPDEAEVYKEGNHLVIRLRAIRFPVGKEVIMPENYGLLSKVQRAIRTFGEPDVTVEGHTDSTGTKVLNDHLSQKRAEAVRSYFVANGTLPEDRIFAVGYGPSRPLATNDTEEGRAINRRIDLVITPVFQTSQ